MFGYGVEGDLRFISHHDTLRMFQRALVRANIPIRWSQGFNPHPRFTIPLPRPVGIASQAESIIVDTETLIDHDDALRRLDAHTPEDICMLSVRRLAPAEKPQPTLVRYRLELGDGAPDAVHERVRQLLASDVVQVRRDARDGSSPKVLDVRRYLDSMEITGGFVEFTLRVTGAGTAKPAEIAGLLGFDQRTINHRIRRMEIQWQ